MGIKKLVKRGLMAPAKGVKKIDRATRGFITDITPGGGARRVRKAGKDIRKISKSGRR